MLISHQQPAPVINIAHRGYHRDFPENTMEAFRAALALGVDGIEFDVQETADGQFFVYHNDDISGQKIAGMPASKIRAIRLQGKYGIPSLQEVLELCGSSLILLVEVKQVKSLDNFLKIIRSCTNISHIVIVSFDQVLIAQLAKLAPDIMRAVITDAPAANTEEITKGVGSAAIGMRCPDANAGAVESMHEEGTMVFVWGCQDAQSVRRVLGLPIDGIISDFPDIVKEYNAARS